MSLLVPITTKAIGLTSIGNPITLIAALDKLGKLACGYKLYVCLNVPQQQTTTERYAALITNSHKILQHYESRFGGIVIIDPQDECWASHGYCIDLIFHACEEQAIAIFEEDAYIFDQEVFNDWFDKLNSYHVVSGMDYLHPNNFWFFDSMSKYGSTTNKPGKESIFFIRKDIINHHNWFSFDYLILNEGSTIKAPFRDESFVLQKWMGFDTFEFFSWGCMLNTNIKWLTYQEKTYNYWYYYVKEQFDAFKEHYSRPQPYTHYFNSAIFYHLSYHGKSNDVNYRITTMREPMHDTFLPHLTTFMVQMMLLLTMRTVYIQLLGKQEYQIHRKSLKQALRYLLQYFGYARCKFGIKILSYAKFTYSYIKTHHGPILL